MRDAESQSAFEPERSTGGLRADPGLTPRLRLWAPVALYMSMIFGLSSIANPPEPPGVFSLVTDKGLHAVLYGGLSALIVRALAGAWLRPIRRPGAALAVILSTMYGATDEVHQYFVPPRQMDALDLAADFVGASIAAGGLYLVSRRKASAAAARAD
jgi:VanZ family protein